MSGFSQDLEVFYQGENTALDIKFYDIGGTNLTDPDSIPTYQIFDPAAVPIASGQGVKLSLGYWQAVWFVAPQATPGIYTIVWTASIGSIPVINNSETFEVRLAVDKPQTQSLICDDGWLRQIKKVIAFPGVENILLDQGKSGRNADDELKEFALWPAMFQYFRKFPKKNRQEYTIQDELILPFPNVYTFGACEANIVEKFGSTSTASSFWDIIRFQSLYGGGTGSLSAGRGLGSYGSKNNFNGLRQSYLQNRQVAQTYTNMYNTFKVYINDADRQIEAYLSVSAKFVVTWAEYSNNFDDIKHSEKLFVIKLAQSYLLFHLAESAQLLDDGQLDKKINFEAIKTRAQELYDEVVTNYWNTMPDIVYLRNQG